MTDPTKANTKSLSSNRQSTDAAQKTASQPHHGADAYLQAPGTGPDVSTLGTDVFAGLYSDFEDAWDFRAAETPASAADPVYSQSGGEFVFADAEEDHETTAAAFSDGGARLYVSPSYSGDQEPRTSDIAATPLAVNGLNVINGTNGGDWLEGTNNADLIFGLAGNDAIFGRRGADTLFGGTGSDSIFGGRGNDTIVGEQGADYIDGGRGADWLLGDGGNDTLLGQGGNDNIFGGSGNDLLAGGGGDDMMDGGTGTDTVSFAGASGGVQATLWFAGAQNTGQGWDTFTSIENAIGSSFDDFLSGDDGGNWLQGRDGDDWLSGGNGNDVLTGGDGDDELIGGAGNDIYDGGSGDDIASFVTSGAGVVVDLSINGPQNTGQGIDSFLSIEDIYGSSSGDLLRGTTGANDILGGGGNDWIWGNGGNDNINGQSGNDVLSGGGGNDDLTGGSGADAFVYGAFFGDGGDDVVHDFEAGTDNVFVEIGFGISDFSDVSLAGNGLGDTVASFNGVFGGSITFANVAPDQIGEDDFFFI